MRRRGAMFGVGLIAVLVLTAWSMLRVVPSESRGRLDGPTAYARPEVLVDTAWVKARLNDPQVRLIDLSGDIETFEAGHLPGAQYVSIRTDLTNPVDPTRGQILTRAALSKLFSNLGIRNSDTVVLYDDNDNVQAARAYWVLAYYQHPDVRIYNGGRTRWVADGESLTTAQTTVKPSNYAAAAPDPAIRTDWQYVVDQVSRQEALFCDTRSFAEHVGLNRRAERGGHVPGSVHIDWKEAVNGDGTFRSAAELYQLYTEAGFTPDHEIIAYCQTGVRSAHTWFVLHELLGYPNVRNYDGSWEEYGNNPDSPIQ
ncbi:MAG: sulfurtransferase [Chloroflexaceae bacterium]